MSLCNYQFKQNPELLVALLATKGTTLVEASPRDTIWGIGLSETNPKAQKRETWRGENLLGQILTEVRDEMSDKCTTGTCEKQDEKSHEGEAEEILSRKQT